MPKYLFTDDLRISSLPERIKWVAGYVQNGNDLSKITNKSDNNNAQTLEFYFNLYKDTDVCIKSAIDPVFAIRNFVKKFQFPNPRTAVSMADSITEKTVLAPYRSVVTILHKMATENGTGESKISLSEILYFIFCNPYVYKNPLCDYSKVIQEILNAREQKKDLDIIIKNQLEWSLYDRQVRELFTILKYASGCFKLSNGWLSYTENSLVFLQDKPFIDDILSYDKYWYPSNPNNYNLSTSEYISYMDTQNTPYTVLNFNLSVDEEKTELVRTDNQPLQQIYYGAPGTGKSFEVRRQVEKLTKQKDDENNPYVFRTTFHPDYDYSSFVGCYKPTMEGKDIIYSFVPQTFTVAYIKAWKEYKQDEQNPKPVCLVIEEINRGNCAQIFGDIFQLLDRKNGFSESPINADKDLCDYLNGLNELPNEAINNNKLQLPPNLYILATMNTSDQSLFPMDSAFKRRWNWKYTSIVDAGMGFQIDIEGAKYNWWDFVNKMNNIIEEKIESEDKKLGYFFAGNNPIIDADCFVSKVLFYLWNDVFKDAELEGTPFKEHSFYKLFNADGTINTDEVMSFLCDEPLKLEWERKAIQNNVEDYNKKPNKRYSINGDGSYAMMTTPYYVLNLISEKTNCSYEDLISVWKDFNYSFIFTEEEYNQRKQDSPNPNFEKTYNRLLLQGRNIYVLNNIWDKTKFDPFVNFVHKNYPFIRIEPLKQ